MLNKFETESVKLTSSPNNSFDSSMERLPFWSSGSYYSHFLTENEIENASFFDTSIFDPIFQSENGKPKSQRKTMPQI